MEVILVTTCFRCWLSTENYYIWSFAGPVVVISFVSINTVKEIHDTLRKTQIYL